MMKPKRFLWAVFVGALLAGLAGLTVSTKSTQAASSKTKSIEEEQVPTWSKEDLAFFLHGTMSTEIVPEPVLRAFVRTYPDLYPSADLSHLGLIPDPEFGWPIGISRKASVPHLGGLPALGINCASCHVANITSTGNGSPVRVLGVTSHFDVEAYFGAVMVATFRTADPANMKRFLSSYLAVTEPSASPETQSLFDSTWSSQEPAIVAAMKDDPFGGKNMEPGALHQIAKTDLAMSRQRLADGADLAAVAHSFLKVFHNMRAVLHVPDAPPEKAPPSSGPGRNDAFGLLSAGLLNSPQPYGPVKFGLVWNVSKRPWVHWDGNTNSPIARNLLASLGLGAPLSGKHADFEFAMIKRQTDLSEAIRAPRYPFAIDQAAAKRGATHYKKQCVSCHGGEESDGRLYAVDKVGTDPLRAQLFSEAQAGRFNKFLAELESAGYEAPKTAGVRATGKYWAASMDGVWARSPYLHNGSVRTMEELLTPANARPKKFHRGSRTYDPAMMGYTDEGAYEFDTAGSGNSNAGHEYGTALAAEQKKELLEYLKTL